jgi:transcriptional regulator with XRE-family HTH domain
MPKKFSQMIKARREELGLTQKEVARRIGATAAYISILENNKELPPPRPTVEALAHALKYSPERLWEIALAERKERFIQKAHGRSPLSSSTLPATRRRREATPTSGEENSEEITQVITALKNDPDLLRACLHLLKIFEDVRRRDMICQLLRDMAKAISEERS